MSESKPRFKYELEAKNNKPYLAQQLEFVRQTTKEAFLSNPWFSFSLPAPKPHFVRLFAGVPPTALNNFFAEAPSRRTIAKAVEATMSPNFLTDHKIRALAAKRFYQPEQWLTTSYKNAKSDYARNGFVLAIDLPQPSISKYSDPFVGKPDEVVLVVPRDIIRKSLVRIAAFGPDSLQYFQSK